MNPVSITSNNLIQKRFNFLFRCRNFIIFRLPTFTFTNSLVGFTCVVSADLTFELNLLSERLTILII